MSFQQISNALASVPTIDLDQLMKSDESEIKRLVEASQMPGVFYLDLKGPSTKASLQFLPSIYKYAQQYFEQDEETKKADTRPGIERGYKSFVSSATFEISHTERLNGEPVLRGPLQACQFEIFALASTCHDVIIHLYKLLTAAIKVDSAELDRPSDTGLKLCYKAATNNAEIAASKEHTDSGLITLLFYDQYTLEIWDSSEKRWELVEPKEGCAIVNIADALQVKSGGRLHSPLHRVVQPKGQCKDRYSAVYFLRP